MRDFAKGLLKLVGLLVILAGIAAGVLFGFFVTFVDVGHNAMAPTMTLGDRVLVWKTDQLGLGEVALCEHPREAGTYVMGRIVGKPGQVVAFDRGRLTINGDAPHVDVQELVDFHDAELGRTVRVRKMVEDILDHDHGVFVREGSEPRMRRPHEVQRGFFLMNDNRTHAGEDSRTFGEVDPSRCLGRVFMRVSAASPELGNAALDIIE